MAGQAGDEWVGEFLSDLATFLKELQSRSWLFYTDIGDFLRPASAEVLRRVERLTERFKSDWRSIDNELKADAGLVGDSLNLKLHGFATWRKEFMRPEVELEGARRQGWSSGFSAKKALDWAKIIVGSLAKLIPGLEFLSEAIDALHTSMKAREPGRSA